MTCNMITFLSFAICSFYSNNSPHPLILFSVFIIIISSCAHKSIVEPSGFNFLFQLHICCSFSSICSLETFPPAAFPLPVSIGLISFQAWCENSRTLSSSTSKTDPSSSWAQSKTVFASAGGTWAEVMLATYGPEPSNTSEILLSSPGPHWQPGVKDGRIFVSSAPNSFVGESHPILLSLSLIELIWMRKKVYLFCDCSILWCIVSISMMQYHLWCVWRHWRIFVTVFSFLFCCLRCLFPLSSFCHQSAFATVFHVVLPQVYQSHHWPYLRVRY